MHKKQIISLGLVAAVALTLAISLSSHTTSTTTQYFDTYRSIGFQTGSSSTQEELSQSTESHSTDRSPATNPGNMEPKVNDTIAPKPPAQATVRMKIFAPDGTSVFAIDLKEGDDLCDNLVEAKAEGKIRSLLIDDSYLETFGSRYAREINGYSNNWTVEVNGVKPLGCSLYEPKIGDQIVWKFGE